MRAVLIGAVAMTKFFLERLIHIGAAPVGVITKSASTFNADYSDLSPLCRSAGIPVRHTADANDPETLSWIEALQPEVIYCWGWSQILGQKILNATKLGVIGYHPTLLPRHRGRHPLIWALALGLVETGSTFFMMDGGVDSGDIVSQRKVPIHEHDDAGSLYRRVADIGCSQVEMLISELRGGKAVRVPQNSVDATYWRKRSALDGRIDWRMSAVAIYNLIRSLSRPYPGSTALIQDKEFKVWRARILDPHVSSSGIEPGRVLSVSDSRISIMTGLGVIELIDHEIGVSLVAGSYL
jgi:methionyl-tRNA formyltransferase